MEDLSEVYNDLIMEHSMNSYNKKKHQHVVAWDIIQIVVMRLKFN